MTHSTANIHNSQAGVGEKTLLIIRHAKSSWDIATLSDFDRPLNERGKKDAPMMAKRLLAKNIVIDAFLTSPAKRAKKTAELIREAYGADAGKTLLQPKLYHAGVEDFFETISQLDDLFNTVAVFSHNPGITSFVNELTEEVQIDNMPTCGIFAVKIQTNKWANFSKAKKSFLFFDYPKMS
jgi:phosphohistidine phosphatase